MRQSLQRAGSAELSVDRFIFAGKVLVLVGIAAAPELHMEVTQRRGAGSERWTREFDLVSLMVR